MRQQSTRKKYLLTGRHSFFSSSLVRFVSILLFFLAVFLGAFLVRSHVKSLPSVSSLYQDWTNKNYTALFEKSEEILIKHPLDGEVLTLHGFASYYLSLEQTDSAESRNFLIESIISLRKAWLRVTPRERINISYVLGKAYYQRGTYYADSSLKYLDYARENGADYADLDEFRGMTAELLGDHKLAVSAFTAALATDPSDLLLFILARNYRVLEDYDKAKQYLLETIRTTDDELLELKSRFELGIILELEGSIEEAEKEFTAILEKDPNYADAHYGLGVVYESREDLIKARAAWRRALRLNPMHEKSRQKLTL